MSAEDHCCRVWSHDGSSRLLHGRFADFAAELAGADGCVVRRGQWVAASAVAAIVRDGRRWRIETHHQSSIAVSPAMAGELRTCGWIGGGARGRGALGSNP